MRNIYYSKVVKDDGTWSYEVTTTKPYAEMQVVDENIALGAALMDVLLECETVRLNDNYDFAVQAQLVKGITYMKQLIDRVQDRAILGDDRELFIASFAEHCADFMMVATVERFDVDEVINKIKELVTAYEDDNNNLPRL